MYKLSKIVISGHHLCLHLDRKYKKKIEKLKIFFHHDRGVFEYCIGY